MTPTSHHFAWQLPVDWTPEQALAVHEALNELLSALWFSYEEVLREHLEANAPIPAASSQLDLFDFDDPLPF